MEITWSFVLRTLKRVDMIARRIDAKTLAEEVLAHHPTFHFDAEYLSDVGDCMRAMDRIARNAAATSTAITTAPAIARTVVASGPTGYVLNSAGRP